MRRRMTAASMRSAGRGPGTRAGTVSPDVTSYGSAPDFIRDHVSSLLQLEALLLVFGSYEGGRSAGSLAAEMYVPENALHTWLGCFEAIGLCHRRDDTYRVADDPGVRTLLGQVAGCYARQPVTVARIIFGAPLTRTGNQAGPTAQQGRMLSQN